MGLTVRGDETPAGEVITAGAAPFTETLDDMIARDEANATSPDSPGAIQFPERPIVDRAFDSGGTSPQSGPAQSDPSLRAVPPSIGASFTGLTLQDQIDTFAGSGFSPPGTMGAIGPSHFVEMLTG
jgi:hypothetical protein